MGEDEKEKPIIQKLSFDRIMDKLDAIDERVSHVEDLVSDLK